MKLARGTISEEDKKTGAASVAEQTASAIDQARVLFAELDNSESYPTQRLAGRSDTYRAASDIPLVQLQNNRHVATAELQSVKQHFEDLRRTVSALATRRKDAKTQGEEASMAFYQLFLVTAAGLVLLRQLEELLLPNSPELYLGWTSLRMPRL
jgi:hypothetical protein